MQQKIGVIGIVLRQKDGADALRLQRILSEYGDCNMGRMGIPDHASGINTISLIVRADAERISALAGKIGRLDGVSVKSAVTSVTIGEDA